MLTLEVDGKSVQVPNGSTVMDAAHKLDIYVPHFCWHKKLTIAANCRMCLVQVEKAPKPQPACATPAAEGMKVWTHSKLPSPRKRRDGILRSITRWTARSATGGECQLQDPPSATARRARATTSPSAWCSTRTWAR
jgi:NADH-quinone oxidoreductase subunit G